jgi:Flp pilus assembly protein TadG
MGKKLKIFIATTRAFIRAKGGNVAMIFAISVLPLMIAAGTGLDFARAMLVRQQMGSALDAAALAVGSSTGLDQAAAQALAKKYFDANYTVNKSDYGSPIVSIPTSGFDSKGSVVITATTSMPTVLMKLVNITALPITTSSNVIWGQTKLWVALVLDNSGSMSQGDASGSKMSALQTASKQLLTVLQTAASNPGDVKVGIVPFTRSINIGKSAYVGSTSIDWGEWEAPPANATTISGAVGPGSTCPFTTGSQGFRCTNGSANGSSNTSNVPASGLICPGIDNGSKNTDHNDRYYNGCFYSVASGTLTTTTTVSKPTTVKQNCTQVGSNPATCPQSSSTTGSSTTTTTTAVTPGTATPGSTTTNTSSTAAPSDGNKSCSTSKGVTTCTWKRTIVTTDVATTVTISVNYTHTWSSNNHSSWGGCVMDRQRSGIQTMTKSGLRTAPATSYDTSNVQPSSGTPDTQFPAENPSSCPAAAVTTLGDPTASGYWTGLSTKIDAMAPGGSTNQGIGMEHGWQMLTTGDPYTTPALPGNTTRYIIMLSDGLNTQDRWWGDGSTEGSTQDGYIDQREKDTCDHAKADGVIIYTIFLDIAGTHGDSAALLYCASDPTKYYDLTSNSAVVTTFNQIAQSITNVRVVK